MAVSNVKLSLTTKVSHLWPLLVETSHGDSSSVVFFLWLLHVHACCHIQMPHVLEAACVL